MMPGAQHHQGNLSLEQYAERWSMSHGGQPCSQLKAWALAHKGKATSDVDFNPEVQLVEERRLREEMEARMKEEMDVRMEAERLRMQQDMQAKMKEEVYARMDQMYSWFQTMAQNMGQTPPPIQFSPVPPEQGTPPPRQSAALNDVPPRNQSQSSPWSNW